MGDPRLQSVDYNEGQIVDLRIAPGYQLMVELSPDEQIRSVAVGDSGDWQVSVNKAGDRLFLKPATPELSTNMTVVTSVRTYNFDLHALSGPTPDMPYTVEFRYPATRVAQADSQYIDVLAAARRISHYKISGDQQLRPLSVTDDGQHTYVAWPKTAAIPAIYTVDRGGNEVLVNGMMGTDDVYVVDGAPLLLTFRIDKKMARAERVYPKKAR